ncbi:MAG TPA: YfhO family protein [Patescibacteria group bacterium]|nr:YfhO family protein [Patescibacteria group bacterium]
METFAKKLIPIVLASAVTVVLFWQFFVRGYIPMPASFMVSWYEPWKTIFSPGGVPAIPHKPVGDDVFRQLYPFKMLASDQFRRFTMPFWNPYNGSGQPLLANLHPGYFNPLSVVLLFGTKTGWSWYILLHAPLVFLSMYFFMRTKRCSRSSSLISSVILTLSGAVVVRYMFGEFLFSFAMLPVLLALIERRWLLPVPFVVMLILVTVQPQISFYILLTALLYARSMRFAGALALGVGMASFGLFPSLELYQNANVTTGSSAFIFEKFLMPVTHLFSVIIPNYFGNSGTYNFWGETDYVETVGSIGMIPVALSLFAIRTRRSRFFVWGVVVTVLMTLDWILPRLLYRLPIPILSTSTPTRLYLLTTFFIAVLAGLGLDEVPRKKTLFGLFLLGVLAVAVSRFLPCPPEIGACPRVALRNSVFELSVFSVGSFLLFLPSVKKFGLIILLFAVGLYNGWKFLPMSPKSYVAMDLPVLRELQKIGPERIAGMGTGVFATDFATQYRYFDTTYYDPLYIKRYGELVSFVNTSDRARGLMRSDVTVVSDATVSADLSFRRERFWDITGSRILLTKKDDALLVVGDPVWQDDHWQLHHRASALPRAYLVYHLEIENDPDALLTQLFSPETDLTRTAFVEDSVSLAPNDPTDRGQVVIDSYTPNSVAISTESPEDAFLVLSDTYYPGWKAYVDGKEVFVYRTNYAFRGVLVPQGTHEIVFRYQPLSFAIGLWMSIVSFGVWGILLIKKKFYGGSERNRTAA